MPTVNIPDLGEVTGTRTEWTEREIHASGQTGMAGWITDDEDSAHGEVAGSRYQIAALLPVSGPIRLSPSNSSPAWSPPTRAATR